MGKCEYTEEQVREAFKLGQQWVKDINDGNQPVSLNEWLSGQDSHSPTEPEFDTLQEGDYVTELTQEQWFDLVAIMNSPVYPIWEYSMRSGMLFNGKILIHYDPKEIKNKLAPEEFLRRAENTFKTK